MSLTVNTFFRSNKPGNVEYNTKVCYTSNVFKQWHLVFEIVIVNESMTKYGCWHSYGTSIAIENSQKPHSTPREYTLHILQQNEVTKPGIFCFCNKLGILITICWQQIHWTGSVGIFGCSLEINSESQHDWERLSYC